MNRVPEIRIRAANRAEPRPDGDFILYWMTAYRRANWNFALQRAVEWAEEYQRPIVILEALRADYPWASERTHRFVLEGMADNKAVLRKRRAYYYPFVETESGEGKGLVEALAERACVVVTDEFPAFFLPRMIEAAAPRLAVHLEVVDSNGLIPLRATQHVYPTAYTFRRYAQKVLPEYLTEFPEADPLAGADVPSLRSLTTDLLSRWPRASLETLTGYGTMKGNASLDHRIGPIARRGGHRAGRDHFREFLHEKLFDYEDARNYPEMDATSGMSSYLHFGHLSAHEMFHELTRQVDWSADSLSDKADGRREGWWGFSRSAEAFLDQLVTWRELGFNMCQYRDDYDRYESLPEWARTTLEEHRKDKRTHRYTLEQFENADTHDDLWNAAQVQLLREGTIHNYLRMLWGKKILEWSSSPQEALEVMIELNNKYALDGRDPNSYSGIFWVLGRYDRPWGPERAIFGKIRYMSSDNTARKFPTTGYIRRYAA